MARKSKTLEDYDVPGAASLYIKEMFLIALWFVMMVLMVLGIHVYLASQDGIAATVERSLKVQDHLLGQLNNASLAQARLDAFETWWDNVLKENSRARRNAQRAEAVSKLHTALHVSSWFIVAKAVAITVALKVLFLWESLRLFLLIGCVAVADGLTERYRRTKGAGPESASIYHRVKRLWMLRIPMSALTLWLLYPFELQGALVWVPVALAMGLCLRFQCKYYKKLL